MEPISRQIEIYEKILKEDVWGKTPLLNVFAGRLADTLKKLKCAQRSEELPDNAVTVYVLLYHQDGCGEKTWVDMLRNIKYAIQSRPVYTTEQEALARISNHRVEGIVQLVLPASTVVTGLEGQYLHAQSVTRDAIKLFFWQGKSFLFNGFSLVDTGVS